MSVGIILDKTAVDNTIGILAKSLRQTLTNIGYYKQWLDTQTDTQLRNAYGYAVSPDEVAVLRSAVADLDKLRTIFEGTATQATVYDFRTFAKLLWGLGL